MTESQRYLRRYWMLLVLGAAIYGVTAGVTLLGARTGANTEIFPIFSWDLFSVVPNVRTDYGLRVLSLDEEPLEPPVFLETLTGLSQRFDVSVHMTIQELGAAREREDWKRIRALQKMLTNNLFAARRVRYELVRRRYDVLERERTGRFVDLLPMDLEGGEP